MRFSEAEPRITTELDSFVLLGVINDNEDALVAQPGQLDGFLEKASAPLAEGDTALVFILDFLRLVNFAFTHTIIL